ncbi:MAG: hypothetical protein JWP66_1377 [Naasia sp.]|nr:hypothetical protein [Naasia sp.]
MGFLDRLLGRDEPEQYRPDGRPQQRGRARSDDEVAIERYRYLLRTAPPETIEQVHAEAFAQLTPDQRRQVYEELTRGPEAPTGDDPESLARSATRTEMRRPGTLERSFGGGMGGARMGGGGMGPSFGSMVGSSLLGTVAGYVIGSALVSAFLPDMGGGDYADGAAGADDAGAAEAGGADGGGDGGGDSGGFGGGDFGGGDFGGGDFGGGDFGGF